MFKRRVYLDYAASTPVDPRVERVIKDSQKNYANPSAIHQEGVLAKKTIQEAKETIAQLAQVKPSEVFFTSSGTESVNLAIQGVLLGYKGEDLPHIVTSTIEHPAVLALCQKLEKDGGAEVSYVGVNEDGLIKLNDLQNSLKKNTILVSVMLANNEIGTVQPTPKISKVIQKHRKENNSQYPYFHSDASQGTCYLSFHVGSLGVDLLTLDSIKACGPRGVGILIKKENVRSEAIILGGGQESNLRSGTENLPGICGFREALTIATKERESESKRLSSLRDYCIKEIQKIYPKSSLNGSTQYRLPNNVNICFPGEDAEFLVIKLDNLGIAVSSSSSCRSLSDNSSSYVIDELGKKNCPASSLRITLGRFTKKSDINFLLKGLKKIFENS